MKYIIVLFLLVTFFLACGKKNNEGSTSEVKQTTTESKNSDDASLKFKDMTFLKSYNNCSPNDTCTYFKVDYIEVISGKNKDKINKLINNILISNISYGETRVSSIQAAADSFMTQFVTSRKEYPDAPRFWYLESSVSVEAELQNIITFSSANSSYMGGAHPYSYFEYYNVNKETGDTLTLSNLFASGFEKKLNHLIDAKFRKDNNLKPGDDLAEKGGLFENKITFNYNYRLSKDGSITFHYNQYEIASYAQGPIEVTLSKEDIAPLLLENSPLK
ncbi:MAG: DUF3298 domain-containing protein [Ignavibacteria bacterium]|nr:DUF3298 domain-containing protein [Ignavibacteria bacterium]